MSNLSTAPNIGKVLAVKLENAGVNSIEILKDISAVNAFIKLKDFDSSSCLSSFYALEGAVQGIRWHNISKERKDELKNIFDKL